MNYLSIENISKGFGDEPLFENLSFGINKGDKLALIAANGTGKSTIMRILNGKEEADSGTVSFAEGIRTGFLEQEPDLNDEQTISEMVNGSHTAVLQTIRAYEKALADQTAHYSTETQLAFEKASARMDAMQAWTYEQRLEQLLGQFGIYDLSQKIGQLSGGQKKRLALALVLLDEPDLLLLDEPTNHLDVDMIEWLEKYLQQQNITLLMVTHDRYFLDRVCNNILELFFGTLYHHKGNYSYYLQKSAEREEALRIETEKAGQQYKQELAWMRRQPKARTTKSKSRIDAFYELKEKASQQRNQQQIKLEMNMNRMGGKVLEMQHVTKSYDGQVVIDGFDYMFAKGERIGIIGPNGAGKTTFLNLITRQVKADKGKIISGDTVVFGYFTQKGFQFEEDKSVIEVVKDIAEVIELGEGRQATASQLLQQFNFPPKMQRQPVSLLSGGEKRRLFLLTVLVKNPNFLLLDEPTNDLDLHTLLILEQFLQYYKGCLLLVSHDRYFMDQVIDQLFVFEGKGKVRGFVGNYSEYRQVMTERERQEREKAAMRQKEKTIQNKLVSKREKKKRTFKEQKEYEQLGLQIDELEKEKKMLEDSLSAPDSDFKEIERVSMRLSAINDLLDEKSFRWLELDEIE
jgi:ABC transport system ATP-binding/permease protein